MNSNSVCSSSFTQQDRRPFQMHSHLLEIGEELYRRQEEDLSVMMTSFSLDINAKVYLDDFVFESIL